MYENYNPRECVRDYRIWQESIGFQKDPFKDADAKLRVLRNNGLCLKTNWDLDCGEPNKQKPKIHNVWESYLRKIKGFLRELEGCSQAQFENKYTDELPQARLRLFRLLSEENTGIPPDLLQRLGRTIPPENSQNINLEEVVGSGGVLKPGVQGSLFNTSLNPTREAMNGGYYEERRRIRRRGKKDQ